MVRHRANPKEQRNPSADSYEKLMHRAKPHPNKPLSVKATGHRLSWLKRFDGILSVAGCTQS